MKKNAIILSIIVFIFGMISFYPKATHLAIASIYMTKYINKTTYLYNKTSKKKKTIAVLHLNNKVKVKAATNTMYYALYGKHKGYIYKSTTSTYRFGFIKKTTSLYNNTTKNRKRTATLYTNNKVQIISSQSAYYRIIYGKHKGYVSKSTVAAKTLNFICNQPGLGDTIKSFTNAYGFQSKFNGMDTGLEYQFKNPHYYVWPNRKTRAVTVQLDFPSKSLKSVLSTIPYKNIIPKDSKKIVAWTKKGQGYAIDYYSKKLASLIPKPDYPDASFKAGHFYVVFYLNQQGNAYNNLDILTSRYFFSD